ncbi:hypothetical protein C7447_10732 [Tenacibaculum adriaticum]|uniref:Magnesium citrate secondary transporter n=1 Tax=Tenacibaculum adriaticum TaxID=413713 RepID=A0A5S5DN42_9FLAO|nr:hypothetical protein C7447_10732 [Tenacibaculum adriaticum]
MRKPLYYYFIFSFVTGTAIYLASFYHFHLPDIIRFYVNDFLIIPIVLTISLITMQKLRNDINYTIPLSVVLYLCAMYAVLFEYFLPKFHLRYTADFIDVILYFLGGILFYYLQKKH